MQRSNRLPSEMAGTWYEVSLDSQGQSVLNRYDLDAMGSYEMFQYSISAQNEVDLSNPVAQLATQGSGERLDRKELRRLRKFIRSREIAE